MPIGAARHLVTLEQPTPTPDGDGGFTDVYTPLDPPTWHARIRPAGVRDLERVTTGTVASMATHVLAGRFHPGITTKTRIKHGARAFSVLYVGTPEARDIDLELLVSEQVA